jgi:large subunit ribosomal protein L23
LAVSRPSFLVILLRKKNQPPNEASFQVPLNFTKFDLRDYLWNLYNVEVRKVRSVVQQEPLKRRNPFTHAFYRPMSKKYMYVDLVQPFQWPALPEDKEPWNHELWQQREDSMRKSFMEQKNMQSVKGGKLKADLPRQEARRDLNNLAKKMLAGRVKWNNEVTLDPKWNAFVRESKKTSSGPPAAPTES